MHCFASVSSSTRWLLASLPTLGVLYTLFVVWPAYASGLALFAGDPKHAWTAPVHLWYLRANAAPPTLGEWLGIGTLLLSFLAARLVLIPLGMVLLVETVTTGRRWPHAVHGWAYIVSGSAIALPLVTWTAASQLMRWLLD